MEQAEFYDDSIIVIFITSASHDESMRNYNHFQRTYFISRYFRMIILASKYANFKYSASPKAEIINAFFSGKIGLILNALLWPLFSRKTIKGKNVILLTEPSFLSLFGPYYKIIFGCKWVVDVWDIPIRFVTVTSILVRIRCWLWKYLLRIFYKFADLFIMSISPDFEFKFFNIDERRLLRLKNAIFFDNEKFSKLKNKEPQKCYKDEFLIICQRSLHTKIMGLDVLQDGFLTFKEYCPKSRLIIVGRIPLEVEEQITRLRNRDDVDFFSFLPNEQLLEQMSNCHALVIPFKDEVDLAQTYPIKLFEAFGVGTPVVSSRIYGIASIVENGINGLLFEPSNSVDLSDKLRLLYDDSNLGSKISEKAYELMADYSCQKKNLIIAKNIVMLARGKISE